MQKFIFVRKYAKKNKINISYEIANKHNSNEEFEWFKGEFLVFISHNTSNNWLAALNYALEQIVARQPKREHTKLYIYNWIAFINFHEL